MIFLKTEDELRKATSTLAGVNQREPPSEPHHHEPAATHLGWLRERPAGFLLAGRAWGRPPANRSHAMRALTIADAAKRLGVSLSHVRALIRQGELPAVHVGAASAKRRTLRILPDDWQAFIARRQPTAAEREEAPLPPAFRRKLQRAGIL